MKLTMTKLKKMDKQELINMIDKAKGLRTVYNGASKAELINQVVNLYNQGLIK